MKHNASEGSNYKSVSPSTLSTEDETLVASLKTMAGRWTSLTIRTEQSSKVAAKFKGKRLVKVTEMVVRFGVDFSNLGAVKEGIESGERGEVQSLPKGQFWLAFPYLIGSEKGQKYLRVTLGANTPAKVLSRTVDEVEVSKEEFESYLIESARKPKEDAPLVLSVKLENIVRIGS